MTVKPKPKKKTTAKRVPATRKPKTPPAAPQPDRRIPHGLALAIFQYLQTRPAGESAGYEGAPEVWRLMASLDSTEPLGEPTP